MNNIHVLHNGIKRCITYDNILEYEGQFQHIPLYYNSPIHGTTGWDHHAKHEIVCHVGTNYNIINNNIGSYISQYKELYPHNKIYLLNENQNFDFYDENVVLVDKIDRWNLYDCLLIILEVDELSVDNKDSLWRFLTQCRKQRVGVIMQKNDSVYRDNLGRYIDCETNVYCFYNIEDLVKRCKSRYKINGKIIRLINPTYIYINGLEDRNDPIFYGDRILAKFDKPRSKGYSQGQIDWLDSVMIDEHITIRHALSPGGEYKIPGVGKVDGYCIENNTVYEYHGVYWHGHPDFYNQDEMHPVLRKPYGELYEKTIQRDQRIKDLGYNLIVKWEHE